MTAKTDNFREFAGYRLDVATKVLWRGTEPVTLQPKEVEILIVLTENPGDVVTKDELLDRVWAGSIVQETNLSRHVYRLRRIFEADGVADGIIQTVPRRGYRFTAGVATPSLVIERHSISKTLIEEVEEGRPRLGLGKIATMTAVAVLLIVGVAAFASWSSAGAGSRPIKLVAVLPPVALSGADEDRALSLGFADAVITGIGKLSDVKSISTSAVSRIAQDGRDPLAVARELGADAVIDGTMQRAGDRIRVTMRIIRLSDERQIWSGSFDESASNIFRLQDMMASRAVISLAPGSLEIGQSEHPTEDIEAYNLYLQGQYLFRRRETGPATGFFRRAVNADPKFAEAWAGLAATSAMIGDHHAARDAVGRALTLEPNLALAHAVDGFLKMFVDWDIAGSRQALNHALGIDPRSVEALHWTAIRLSIEGDTKNSIEYLRKALELDPTSANLYDDLGHTYYLAGDFGAAERELKRANELVPDKSTHRLSWVYEMAGRDREALGIMLSRECPNLRSGAAIEVCTRPEMFSGDAVRMSEFRKRLAAEFGARADDPKLDFSSKWYAAALWQIRTGDRENAIRNLKLSFENKAEFEILNFTLPFIASDPIWAPLHDDPRFIELTKRFRPAL